ncbi:MAG: hypothetical protein ACE5F1_04310 [Planctomycetota bacterium]
MSKPHCLLLGWIALASCQTTELACNVDALGLEDGRVLVSWRYQGAYREASIEIYRGHERVDSFRPEEGKLLYHRPAQPDGEYRAVLTVTGTDAKHPAVDSKAFRIATYREEPTLRFLKRSDFPEVTPLGTELLLAVPEWGSGASERNELTAVAAALAEVFFGRVYRVEDAAEIRGIQSNRQEVLYNASGTDLRQALAARAALVVDMRPPGGTLLAQVHVALFDLVTAKLGDAAPVKVFEAYRELEGYEPSDEGPHPALIRGIRQCLVEIAGDPSVQKYAKAVANPEVFTRPDREQTLRQALGLEIPEDDEKTVLHELLLSGWSDLPAKDSSDVSEAAARKPAEQGQEPEPEEKTAEPAEPRAPRSRPSGKQAESRPVKRKIGS